MPLSSIIERAIQLNTHMGTTIQTKAVHAAVPLIKADAGAVEEALYIAASRLIHERCTRNMRILAGRKRQRSFFSLRERYALDLDQRIYKDTDRLTRLEWRRCIEIRRKQIADDQEHLRAMEAADQQLAIIWDEHPDKLFGEVENIYLSRRSSGDHKDAA